MVEYAEGDPTPIPDEEIKQDDSPIQAPLHVNPPEDPKLKEAWQTYLQKCCEAGQIDFQLTQLDSQRRQMEKTLEVTKDQARKAALKHREIQKQILTKENPSESGH